MVKTLVVIPARYGSSRFPGKPLAKIAGKEMLLRVVDIARKGTAHTDARIVVATEDERITDFCKTHGIECLMTSDACKTGSDRVCEAVKILDIKPELIINLQGDNPVCPPWFIEELIKAFEEDPTVDLVRHARSSAGKRWTNCAKAKSRRRFRGRPAWQTRTAMRCGFQEHYSGRAQKEDALREKRAAKPGAAAYRPVMDINMILYSNSNL